MPRPIATTTTATSVLPDSTRPTGRSPPSKTTRTARRVRPSTMERCPTASVPSLPTIRDRCTPPPPCTSSAMATVPTPPASPHATPRSPTSDSSQISPIGSSRRIRYNCRWATSTPSRPTPGWTSRATLFMRITSTSTATSSSSQSSATPTPTPTRWTTSPTRSPSMPRGSPSSPWSPRSPTVPSRGCSIRPYRSDAARRCSPAWRMPRPHPPRVSTVFSVCPSAARPTSTTPPSTSIVWTTPRARRPTSR